jgi:hypothetical protein
MSEFKKMSQFQNLYAKVLSDSDFRNQLVSDPSDALESVGIAPTPEILSAIQSVITAVTELGADLEGIDDVMGTACVS